ncbi:MAG: zf-HC2 domain-containing protein [Acidimicrobiia bacterium]|nr:zf-HC2 domain-containing protein [Acidimicrobiia bacterium]
MRRLLDRLRGTMSCGDVLKVIQSYIDGEINATTARRVAAHLEQCDPCADEEYIYGQIKASLARRRHKVDMDVLDQLMSFGERLKTDPNLGD